MIWIAPSEKDTDAATLEKRLWDTADTATCVSADRECKATWRDFRRAKDHWSANSGLKAQKYSGPILGIICVSSARFDSEHNRNSSAELSIYGVETGRLCRLNLAVHGLDDDICHGGQVNSYYDDPHKATGQFDFVLANPPFNVNAEQSK